MGFDARLSWVLAAETPTTRGSPFASNTACILEPGLPRCMAVVAVRTHGDDSVAQDLRGDRMSPAMRRFIAEHPDPAARDAHGDVSHVRPLLVDHPNLPRHTLRTFVDEPNPDVGYVALQDPDLPVAALQQLAAAE